MVEVTVTTCEARMAQNGFKDKRRVLKDAKNSEREIHHHITKDEPSMKIIIYSWLYHDQFINMKPVSKLKTAIGRNVIKTLSK